MTVFWEQFPGKGLVPARTFRPSLKVLVVTGYAKNAGVGTETSSRTNLIVKPFGMSEFAGKMRELIKA